MSIQTIQREPLLKAAVGDRHIDAVDVRRIRFGPGQQTGRHQHPCPVVGYIVDGTAILQVEGHPAQTLPAGSAFHEPGGSVIARFDNASNAGPMTFIAFYLLNGNQELIEMLEIQ